MKFTKTLSYSLVIFSVLLLSQACKTKKLAQKPVANADTVKAPAVVEQPKPQPKDTTTQVAAAPATNKEDYSFANIQFEFNSAVLKTASYPSLDNTAATIKANPSVKFILKGYASAEGTDEHNMSLSIDRANSVKTYLLNSGINAANLSIKGFGEADPIADNATEDGRVLNRRVEIKKLD